jgi:uncharacterized protein YndB with AHSA1/START domain
LSAVRPRLSLERKFRAPIDEVWELWTTAEGIEAWWGPEGFEVRVGSLDLRPGGRLTYVMSAVAADQVDYMKKAGMPVSTRHSVEYMEVKPPGRLAFRTVADFIPGVEPYEIDTVVELSEVEGGTHLVITFDAMHDDRWTQLARLGNESQLERLERLLASRR